MSDDNNHKFKPDVMSVNEVKSIMSQLTGHNLLLAKFLYGSGLRLREAIRLRVKDLDFDNEQILIYDGKGKKIVSLFFQLGFVALGSDQANQLIQF